MKKINLQLAICCMASLAPCRAEVALDGSLGGPSGPLLGPNFEIGANLGRQVGSSLFHSFGAFNINDPESATFTPNGSSGPIANVLSRVTGGSPSTLNGALNSTIPDASLFFLNRAGIVFGPNASLNVQGSFHASTADFIELADGVRFDALPSPNDALLTTAPPAAFGFLDGDVLGAISVNASSLQGAASETLSLIGGDILVSAGMLAAPDGRINLVSVASAGSVSLDAILDLQDNEQLGTIRIGAGSSVQVTGAGDGVFIRGGEFALEGGSQVVSVTDPFSAAPGGAVFIETEQVTLEGASNVGSVTGFFSTGAGGNISLSATGLRILNGSSVLTATRGSGQAGAINVEVGDLLLSGANVFSSTFAPATGRAGDITVRASRSVTGLAASGFNSFSSGSARAGDISVATPHLELSDTFLGTASLAEGEAGDVLVDVQALVLSDGAVIGTGSFGTGDAAGGAGTVRVDASESVSASGSTDGLPSGIRVNTFDGDAGRILVSTPRLDLEGGAISGASAGSGDAADIELQVGTLNLSGGGFVESLGGGTGPGGDISVTASDSVSIRGRSAARVPSNISSIAAFQGADAGRVLVSAPRIDIFGGTIATATLGEGDAGAIALEADELTVAEGGIVSSSTFGGGGGGNVGLSATDSVLLTGIGSGILAGSGRLIGDSPVGRGDSGSIAVSAATLLIEDRAGISAATTTDGDAGDIDIEVGRLSMSEGGFIANSSGVSIGEEGALQLQRPESGTVLVGSGQAGDITVNASQDITITSQSGIDATTFGMGRGGNVEITAPKLELSDGGAVSAASLAPVLGIDSDPNAGRSGTVSVKVSDTLRLLNGGQISVESAEANAGDIDLDVGFLLHLRDGSRITTSVAGGQGDGGNITIDPVFTVLDGGSSIIARAREGRGGNIRIVSDFLFVSPDSLIDASSELGVSGVVDLESPETDVVTGALALPESFLDAASLLSDRCTARAIKGASRFIVSGRGGVPPGPETVLPSFPELGLNEAPKAKANASVSQGTIPVGCAIE